MFAVVFAALLAGYAVAPTLAGVALLFAFGGALFGVFDLSDLGFLPGRLFGIVTNQTLIAVPLFVAMGITLERTRIAETLLESLSALMGRVPWRSRHGRDGGRHDDGGEHRHRWRDRGHPRPAGAPDHAAPRLRPEARHRHDLRDRHTRPDHSPVDRAGAARRRAVERLSAGTAEPRPVLSQDGVRRRPVCRGPGTGPDTGRPVSRLHRDHRAAPARAGPATTIPHARQRAGPGQRGRRTRRTAAATPARPRTRPSCSSPRCSARYWGALRPRPRRRVSARWARSCSPHSTAHSPGPCSGRSAPRPSRPRPWSSSS